MKDGGNILIVDDEPTLRLGFEYALTTEGFQVTTAKDGEDALRLIDKMGADNIDALVLDLRMPGKTGIDVLRELKVKDTRLPTIMASAFMDSPTAIKAIDLGVVDFLRKPATPDELRGVVAKILDEENRIYDGDSRDCVTYARWCIRRGQLSDAHSALEQIDSEPNGDNPKLWLFISAHLLACHENGDGEKTEFASSRFYKAADLLEQLAFNR